MLNLLKGIGKGVVYIAEKANSYNQQLEQNRMPQIPKKVECDLCHKFYDPVDADQKSLHQKKFKCFGCDLMWKHCGDDKLVCYECESVNKKAANKKAAEDWKRKEYKACNECGVTYNHADLEQILNHDHNYVKCKVCLKTYDSNDATQKTEHEHEIRCDKCDQIYLSYDEVAKDHHQNEEICPICHLIFDRRKEPNHQVDAHPTKRYCAPCQQICNISEYLDHLNHVLCEICEQIYDREFEKIENLHNHDHSDEPGKLRPIPVDPPSKWSKLIESDEDIDYQSKPEEMANHEADQKKDQKKDQILDQTKEKEEIDLETEIDQDALWKNLSEILGEKPKPKPKPNSSVQTWARGRQGRPPLPPKTTIMNGSIIRTPATGTIPSTGTIPVDSNIIQIKLKIVINQTQRPEKIKKYPRNITVKALKTFIKKELNLFPQFRVHIVYTGSQLKDESILSSIVQQNHLVYAVILPPTPKEDDDELTPSGHAKIA